MSLLKLRRAENRLPLYSLPVPLLDLRGHPQTVTRSRAARALPLCQGWAHPLSFRVGDRVSRVLLFRKKSKKQEFELKRYKEQNEYQVQIENV